MNTIWWGVKPPTNFFYYFFLGEAVAPPLKRIQGLGIFFGIGGPLSEQVSINGIIGEARLRVLNASKNKLTD